MKKYFILITFIFAPFFFIICATLGLFKFFSTSYESNLHLLLFLILVFLLEFVITTVLLLFAINLNKIWLDFLITFVTIYISDQILDSVSFNLFAIILMSLVLTSIEFIIDSSENYEVED